MKGYRLQSKDEALCPETLFGGMRAISFERLKVKAISFYYEVLDYYEVPLLSETSFDGKARVNYEVKTSA